MSDPNALEDALVAAQSHSEILAALARACWHNDHDGAACPPQAVPTPEAFATWVPACPPDPAIESCDRILRLCQAAQKFREACANPRAIVPDLLDLSDRTLRVLARLGTGQPLKPVLQRAGSPARTGAPAPMAARVTPIHPVARFETLELHRLWQTMRRLVPEHTALHPLAPTLRAWQRRAREIEPFRPATRASLPRIHCIGTEAADLLMRPLAGLSSPAQPDLPGGAHGISGCPPWLLRMYDLAAGTSMAQGRGAPWSMRLFVGALLHLGIHNRDTRWHALRFDTEYVIGWLHPEGWGNRHRDWERFPGALDAMFERLTYVHVAGVGGVAMVFPSEIPRTPSDPYVEFTARIPATAARGARIDWPRLCAYGTRSAALYRAYLSSAAYLDHSARRGRPITAEISAPVRLPSGEVKRRRDGSIVRTVCASEPNPSARFVRPITEADMARMIGLDPTDKRRRYDARRAFEQLCDDGVIDLRRDGRAFRLFGPATR